MESAELRSGVLDRGCGRAGGRAETTVAGGDAERKEYVTRNLIEGRVNSRNEIAV